MSTLSEDLNRALVIARGETPCKVCAHLAGMEEGPEKNVLASALAGTIGVHKLVGILRQHDVPLGRRVIEKHRREKAS